ncbi:MAG: class I SAM-dependent methyltransferase [Thermoleophilaceae bacterium]|nr:class I SAM-dependent methyltransferase [Thermoleophilaceae bacterium]
MSDGCRACGKGPLADHLKVKAPDGSQLVATTTRYGSAPDDIVRCENCGHMQVAQFPPDAQLDEAYAEVTEAAYLDQEAGQRATAARALERIERHVDRGQLCDLGCWVGFLVSEAERRGWEAWGVEPSAFASEFARERLGLRVQEATLASADLPEGAFDAVVLDDVIEHLPNPGEALERVRELLSAEGVLHLTLPDAGSRVARGLGMRWWSVIPTHVQYFTRHSLAELLTTHGFTVEWVDTAPKAFTVRYYLERLEGYSAPVSSAAVRAAQRIRVADRLVWPDFRDRMAVVARRRA